MANPLHANIADRVDQLTPVDADCDNTATYLPTDDEWPVQTTDGSAERFGRVEHPVTPHALLAHAVSSLDEPVDVAAIDRRPPVHNRPRTPQ